MSCKPYPKIDTLYERDKETFKVDTTQIRRSEFTIPSEWLVTEKIHGTNVRVSLEENVLEPEVAGARGIVQTEWALRLYGRGENSQMPPLLLTYLQDTFTLEGLKSLWRCKKSCEICRGGLYAEVASDPDADWESTTCPNIESYPITLYGEGYGGGIQKGGGEYTSKAKGGAASFRLFDVLVGETWLRRADVKDVAAKLSIKTVPLLAVPDHASPGGAVLSTRPVIVNIVDFVRQGIESVVAEEEGTPGHMAEGIVAFTEEPLYNNRGQRLMFKLKSSDFA